MNQTIDHVVALNCTVMGYFLRLLGWRDTYAFVSSGNVDRCIGSGMS